MTDNKSLTATFRPPTLADVSILIVDDSPEIRKATSMLLEYSGFPNIHSAVDGMDGLDVLRSHHIDLVISDVQMPNLNGIDFLKFVKADDAMQGIPVIITSGAEGMEAQALKYGAHGFVEKGKDPFIMIGLVTELANQMIAHNDDAPECPALPVSQLERHHS